MQHQTLLLDLLPTSPTPVHLLTSTRREFRANLAQDYGHTLACLPRCRSVHPDHRAISLDFVKELVDVTHSLASEGNSCARAPPL